MIKDRRGRATITLKANDFQRKTTITEAAAGFQTTGVLQIDRIAGITEEARQVLTVRDALYARPTNLALVDFVKVGTKPAAGTMTAEATRSPRMRGPSRRNLKRLRRLRLSSLWKRHG